MLSVNQIPQPPVEMLVPTAGAIVFVYIVREAWRTRSAFPLAFMVAGAIGVFVEPVYDSNMHVWFAQPDSPLFTSYNISYPWYALIGESIMAGPIYWMYRQFQRGVTTRALWGYFIFWWLYQMLLEIPGNLTNSYIYYGPHPFQFFGFPLWLGLCLAFGLPLAGYVAYKLREILTGAQLWVMAVILIPVTLFGSQLIGWPMWVTLNGAAGSTQTYLAALASLVFSVCGYYCLTLMYAKERAGKVAA
jgi:hypothetical protein